MRLSLNQLSVNYPKSVFMFTLLLSLVALAMLFNVKVDTDPENMLPHNNPARVLHDSVKQKFALSEMMVVGIVNNQHENGVYNIGTLNRLKALSEKVVLIDGVIAEDLMSLSNTDNISQTEDGAVAFHWMIDGTLNNQAQADLIKSWVSRLPMINNTLVSGDGKAAGIYIPIVAKDQSYRIYQEINKIIKQLEKSDDEYFITGLPVAEDTFGVEMFTQMAISAPAAGLLIFVIMLFFFRSMAIVAAPMIVAMATVILTMGAMIGVGFPVHIMSSMIPIFLMPIAVVNAIHMLSTFTDHYRPGMDKKALIQDSVKELFRPMLFTSITSLVGFVSLNTADIPPVKVFGSFVAIGIAIAFLLTIVFIPAYISVLSDKQLNKMASRIHKSDDSHGLLARALHALPAWIERHSLMIVLFTVVLVGFSGWGISKINVNDNPMNWFQAKHPIREADRALNSHFAGTYQAFLSFDAKGQDGTAIAKEMQQAVQDAPQTLQNIVRDLLAEKQKDGVVNLAALNEAVINQQFMADAETQPYWDKLSSLLDSALQKPFLEPKNLAYLQKVQNALDASGLVGKSMGLVDLLKTVNRELKGGDEQHYVLPENAEQAAQSILTYQSSHTPKQIWHIVTPDYSSSVVWLQLKSGDNQDMNKVVDYMDNWFKANPVPENLSKNWSGLTYINVVWQDTMVNGMLGSLASSFVIVGLMMIFLFRSLSWGLIAMLPLSVTISLIYGLIGWIGKNYDMPVAVLSALTLGMSVDFAIHFIERAKLVRNKDNWRSDLINVFDAPGRAIARNAIVIALGFTPLLVAPLVPYQTVGVFMALIMAISCLVTLILIPALSYQFQRLLFR